MKIYKQNFENKVSTVKIGKENIVNIGGDSNLPFYEKENDVSICYIRIIIILYGNVNKYHGYWY